MLVTGKVQADEDSISILVDRVQTSFTHASPDEEENWLEQLPPPPGDEEWLEPWAEPAVPIAPPPPPPPNFVQEGEVTYTAPPIANGKANGRNGHPAVQPTNGKSATTPSAVKEVRVSVDPAVDWQSSFRQAAALAEKHNGQDKLLLELAGRGLVMELQNRPVDGCPEFIAALQAIPGVARVVTNSETTGEGQRT